MISYTGCGNFGRCARISGGMPLNFCASIGGKKGIMERALDILYWRLPGVGRLDATTEAQKPRSGGKSCIQDLASPTRLKELSHDRHGRQPAIEPAAARADGSYHCARRRTGS